ncbi:MAG: DUF5666 domain-containing protein [Candidatus Shapirobacteria bacterium]
MKSTNILLAVLILILVGGGAFFAGTKYQQSKTPQVGARGQFGNGQTGGNRQGTGMRGGAVVGEIQSLDSNTLTIKTQDGGSKIVILSDLTKINKAAEATKNDLMTGQTVSIFGTANTDGSVTAQNIQLNPIMRAPGNSTGTPTPTK